MLVVPDNQDSILAVPITPGAKTSGHASLDIVDLDAMPVLKVVISRPTPGAASGVFSFSGNPASAQRLSTASIRSSPGVQDEPAIALKIRQIEPRQTMLKNGRLDDSGVLILGYLSTDAQGQPAMDICAADGAMFAKLEKSVGGSYKLQVGKLARTKMVFRGKFQDHEVKVENENGVLLAGTEPCTIPVAPGTRFMRVTIKQKVDAGVVLVALTAIEERFV